MIETLPIEERPEEPALPDWLVWIWRAWHRLTHDRPWHGGGMGPPQPGRIAWATVMDWAERHRYPPDETALLDHGIQAMDEAFLAWWSIEQQRRAAVSMPAKR